ncbi:RagB/SusD family nutrient uptake outer membrane protein [Ulvibacter litoralis]|uniref:SusD family protein n=1 Tax=Ulvibacter litoralis TaxID=227084 RepID=A0A1G7JEZ2_9FLAO|nr:RagB/SusD family nutrient uptake outer membrane protein [Ulvibacter litoralis]GHC64959.1 membrane protein [Ulvibacter litoralis]SDF23453.1 SusD family protein [Ulvibacter litoralis]
MKNTYKILIQSLKWTLILVLIPLVSCENIEVETPNHLLSGETLFTDPNTVEAAILSIYANLRDNVICTGAPQGMSNLMGNYADEITYYSTFSLAEEQFNKNTLVASNPTIEEIWNNAYNQIYAANAIIEGVEGSVYFTEDEQKQYIGEALFCRALVHFYLLNLYGDIPYCTTTDYRYNQTVSRQSEAEVYNQIISDLLQAKEVLTSTDESGEHLRPNKYTAMALLARCYLYTQNWEQAEAETTQLIENNGWETNIENVFLNNATSTLWQFSPNNNGGNTLEADTFIILAAPPSTRALSNHIVDAFEEDDLRKVHWVGQISDATNTFYYPYKYKIGLGAGVSQEYSIVFRMAEQYLIRAEARGRQGNISEALIDINKIRNRAGLNNTTATTETEVLAAVMQERKVELFTEHGHRFFDLKRNGQLDAVLGVTKPGWNHKNRLLPIPQRELLVNPNLQPQNQGY